MLGPGYHKYQELPDLQSSTSGGTSSCSTGPSGRYIRTGTLLTVYAPSRSETGGPEGSVDGGLDGDSVEFVVSPRGANEVGGELIVLVPFGFEEV